MAGKCSCKKANHFRKGDKIKLVFIDRNKFIHHSDLLIGEIFTVETVYQEDDLLAVIRDKDKIHTSWYSQMFVKAQMFVKV